MKRSIEPCLCGDPDCPRCFPRTQERWHIYRHRFQLLSGNILEVFFNDDDHLLVVDLIDSGQQGGSEIVRMTIDEEKLLGHCNHPAADSSMSPPQGEDRSLSDS